MVVRALKSRDGDAMFLVGVGHLVGRQGLIQLLTARGYQVVQWAPGN